MKVNQTRIPPAGSLPREPRLIVTIATEVLFCYTLALRLAFPGLICPTTPPRRCQCVRFTKDVMGKKKVLGKLPRK